MSEHKQKIHIYHCCMLYLTDPGLVALFKLGVLKKVWLRPQVGNCLLFSAEPLSVVIHGRCLFTNLSPFMTVWGVTRENSRSFYRWIAESELLHSQIRASHRLGLPERNAQARRSLCPFLFSPNRNLKKSSRLWGSLTPRRWVVTAWPTLRKNAKKKTSFLHSPEDLLLQSQRSAPRRAADGPGWREGGCCVVLDEFRPVFHTPCVWL